MNAFTLFGRIALDDKQYQAGLKKAETETSKSTAKIEQDWKKVGDQITKTGKTVSLFVTGPLAGLGAAFVRAASDAEETGSKFSTVFQSLGNDADLVAQRFADSFGLSSTNAQRFLVDTSDLLTGFGFTAQAALNLSEEVNSLAIDLASFTNFSGGAEGASAALTKALLGETESAKSLGIVITQELVQARIEELRANGELLDSTDQQARAYATLQIAQEQSFNAIGDYARTSDSFANTTRRLGQEWNEVAITFGNVLLPVATDITRWAVDFVKRISQLDDVTIKLIVSISAFAAAIGPALLITAQLLNVVPAITTAFTSLRLAMLALVAGPAAPFLLIGLAIGALFLAWQNNVGGMQETFAAFVADVRESFERTWRSLTSAFEAISSAWSSLASENSENWSRFTAFANRVFGNLVTGLLGGIASLLRGFARIIEITSNIIVNFEELGTAARLIFEEIQRIVTFAAFNMRLSFQAFVLQVRLFFADMANNIRDVFFNIVDGIRSGFNQLVGVVEPVASAFGISVNRMEQVNRDAFAQIGADVEAELIGITDSINFNNRQISQAQRQIAETVRTSLGIITASSTAASDSTGDLADAINEVDAAANQTGDTLRNTFTPAVTGTGEAVDEVVRSLRELVDEYLELARVARLASTDQNMFNMAGLEGSSNVDAFNDHLKVLARDQENAAAAGLLGSDTLEEFAAAAERAALRAAEMNAGLDAGAPLLRLTAVEAAAAATSLADFMRVQVALGAAGEADLLRVLQNQAAALQVARSAVNAGTDEWINYSRELIEVNQQIDALNASLTVTEPSTLDVANANLRAARAAKLLGDETADVAGALSLQVLEMEGLLGTLDPTSEAYLRLAESIAAAKDEMLKLNSTKLTALDFAGTISTAVAGLAVTMIGLAAAGGDVARNVALAFAEMAQNVLNQILTMAIAELVLHNIRTALAASSPFTAWMIFGLAAGALAAGALVAQLRSMGARAPGGASGGGSGGGASSGIIGSLQDRRSFLSNALTEATSEQDIELINKQIQQIDEELRRLRGIGIDEETGELVDNLPVDSSAGRRDRDVGFGGVPQSVQLAVSTPLLEASNRMLDAATMMQQVFGSMLPGSMTPDASMGNFAGVLSRMTPVLERLLTEGVEIRTAGLAQPQSAGLAFLR